MIKKYECYEICPISPQQGNIYGTGCDNNGCPVARGKLKIHPGKSILSSTCPVGKPIFWLKHDIQYNLHFFK